jgi:hypothetical protein
MNNKLVRVASALAITAALGCAAEPRWQIVTSPAEKEQRGRTFLLNARTGETWALDDDVLTSENALGTKYTNVRFWRKVDRGRPTTVPAEDQ